jgi:hypothetical protein
MAKELRIEDLRVLAEIVASALDDQEATALPVHTLTSMLQRSKLLDESNA